MLLLFCRIGTQGYHSVCVTSPTQKLLWANSHLHGSISLSRQVLVIPQHKKSHSTQVLLHLKICGTRLRDQKGFKQNLVYYPVMRFIIKPQMLTAVSCLSPCISNSSLSLFQADWQKDILFQKNTHILYPYLTFNLFYSIAVNHYFTALNLWFSVIFWFYQSGINI